MASDTIISVRNLSKTFGNFTAVDNISFEVPHGQIFAFLGPNGAGKSTTIKMLTTLLSPSEGEIMLNNFDVTKQQHDARKSFGIVFQDPSTDDELTAYENMELHAVMYKVPSKSRHERIESLLKFVELWERKDSQVKTFSGGMKRRLEIARGLLHHPKILFLDEPTIGLDPQTRNHIWEYIQNLNQKEHMTIFFTTHYMEEAEKIAERIAIMDHGKIITIGNAQELKKQTKTNSLEEAFLKLTGSEIREEEVTPMSRMKMRMRGGMGR
ncbi:MAG TPA: ATP-binding cassette domain-containing protein [Patescibacteria group bacterium]|nr:ATP-binding cassette domain-containing protein [Patescibacteria group bacterium]